ncbi:4'-phosphopantetheinyl transferase family protein [Syntrophomonas curvata]
MSVNRSNYFENYRNLTMQEIYSGRLQVKGPEETFKAGICICHFPAQVPDYMEVLQHLHPLELNYYETLVAEKRKKSYLLGRYSAKQAVFSFVGIHNPQNIFIKPGCFTQPIFINNHYKNVQVSISHCDDIGAAVAFPEELLMGIDIERVDTNKVDAMESQMTANEIDLVKSFPDPYITMLTLLWTAKEALSKVLKTGLMTPFHVFEIDMLQKKHNSIALTFQNFGQYQGISFNLGNYINTIVYPKNTEMDLDIQYLKKKFMYLL